MPRRVIPNDYDGVVANYPAYNVTLLHLGSLNVGRALYEGGGAAWINPAEEKLITDAVYAKCDALDGAKDGIISDVKACNEAFDVKTLRCANGADSGDACLSDAQLAAVAKITRDYKPGFAIAGMDTFPRWALLEGALFQGRSSFGQVPQPSNPLSGKEPLLYTAGDQTAKFIITRNPDARHDEVRSEAVSGAHRDRRVDHGRHRREPGEVQGQGRQDHHDPRHRGRLHHAAQQRALLPAAGEAVRPGRAWTASCAST